MWGWIAYDPDLNLIYLRHRQSRPVERRAAARRQQVDRRHLRARSRHRRRRTGPTSINPHDEHDYDGDQRADPARHAVRRAGCGKVLLHPDRNGYLYVIDRTTGEVLSADPYGPVNSITRRRSQDRPADRQSGQGDPARHRSCTTSARPRPAPRTGTRRLLAAHRPDLHPARESLHGLGERRRRITSPARPMSAPNVHHEARPRRQSRRVHRLGSGAAPRPRWTIKEDLPVWSGTVVDRGRSRLLRNDGRLVQGGRCAQRRAAVAVQDRLRDHRPAGRLSRARTATNTSPSCPASAAGPARSSRGDLDPRDRPARSALSAPFRISSRRPQPEGRSMFSRCRSLTRVCLATWRSPLARLARELSRKPPAVIDGSPAIRRDLDAVSGRRRAAAGRTRTPNPIKAIRKRSPTASGCSTGITAPAATSTAAAASGRR